MNNHLQKVKIIYEDPDIIVVNKEAGIEVDQPRGENENNIVNYLRKYFNQKNLFLVHRLDKFTSGLVVLAKNEKAQKNLEQQFRERKVKKVYHAIVLGIFDKKHGVVDASIGLDRKIKQKRTVMRGGEKAITNYETLKRIGGEFTLIKLEPVTGRTHQLRVHMEYIGHPIVGDKLYYGRVEGLKTKGFALIAKRIEFHHPTTNRLEKFEIKYGEEFERLLEELK
ncbi:MAG TPA: RluA family pseudouridine synthase [Patescibacteria group bacterium]|nr:RluA family pseudouridine synthase [Patescibacteria group bacterium]